MPLSQTKPLVGKGECSAADSLVGFSLPPRQRRASLMLPPPLVVYSPTLSVVLGVLMITSVCIILEGNKDFNPLPGQD